MNREILFRGKRLDNGQWMYGSLVQMLVDGRIACCICTVEEVGRANEDVSSMGILYTLNEDIFIVNPATVGQYTGVVDRLGKQVFEDDIIGYTDSDTGKTKIFGVVKWYHEGNFYINTDTYCNYTSDNDCANIGYMMNRATTKLSVIGNIHDNPSMLKGGEK